ncbi:MAG TPA: ATP-binding protein, partial [Thermoprotei archaeon]|nr:ATP-binding protein [Thermoprotei archaeon]
NMYGGEKGILPVRKWNIDIVSLDFLIPDEDTPIIWRGPLKTRAITQFLSEVYWGKKDILLVDLPPGTGDEALSIAQNIPNISGSIIVTIPSQVSEHVVKKAITFNRKLNIPILGIIENMSYFICPKCGEKYYLFGKNGGKELSKKMNVRLLGSIPIDPKISLSGDEGIPFLIKDKDSQISREFLRIAEKVLEILTLSNTDGN